MNPWYNEAHYVLLRDTLAKRTSIVIPTEETYHILRENGLSGTVFPSLNQHIVPKAILDLFRRDYLEYIRRGTLQEEAIQEISALFAEHQIRHVFLKGSHLRQLYPEPLLRSMGDIDILVEEDNMELIHQILPSKGYLLHAVSSAHDCFHKGKKVVVEIHPTLENHFDERYVMMFKDVWGHVHVEENQEIFDPIFEAGYLSYHMIKHLSTSGIGLRNIVDLALFLSSQKENVDSVAMHGYFQTIGIDTFFQHMILLAINMFEMPELSTFVSIGENASLLEEAARFISRSGVHGKGESHNRFLAGMSKQSLMDENIHKGKVHYLFKLAFPSRKQLDGTYLYLQKAPWLLPWAWIQRWFRLLFVRTKSTFQRVKKLRVKNQEIMEIESLYRQLGL